MHGFSFHLRPAVKTASLALGCIASASPVHLEFQAFFHSKLAQPVKLVKNTATG
jgi:hypothetical protein